MHHHSDAWATKSDITRRYDTGSPNWTVSGRRPSPSDPRRAGCCLFHAVPGNMVHLKCGKSSPRYEPSDSKNSIPLANRLHLHTVLPLAARQRP